MSQSDRLSRARHDTERIRDAILHEAGISVAKIPHRPKRALARALGLTPMRGLAELLRCEALRMFDAPRGDYARLNAYETVKAHLRSLVQDDELLLSAARLKLKAAGIALRAGDYKRAEAAVYATKAWCRLVPTTALAAEIEVVGAPLRLAEHWRLYLECPAAWQRPVTPTWHERLLDDQADDQGDS